MFHFPLNDAVFGVKLFARLGNRPLAARAGMADESAPIRPPMRLTALLHRASKRMLMRPDPLARHFGVYVPRGVLHRNFGLRKLFGVLAQLSGLLKELLDPTFADPKCVATREFGAPSARRYSAALILCSFESRLRRFAPPGEAPAGRATVDPV